MTTNPTGFNLSTVFATVAATIPDHTMMVWRNRRFTYADVDARVDGFAHYLVSAGMGCHTERDHLAGHESGQDHLALYLRNGNEYLEAMLGSYRARVAPFNCSYRYVETELCYLLNDARASGVVYNAEFAPRVAAIRDELPHLTTFIQVADDSGNELLPGAVDYESTLTGPRPAEMPTPSGEDLYMLYTGGTTGMPKGVLWRQHDIFLASMGGRPFGSDTPMATYDDLAAQASQAAGSVSILMTPPLMHGAAQWAAFNAITMGGWLAIPDDVTALRADGVLRLAERERVLSIPVVGDAMARPLLDEIETGDYDLTGLMSITNGGAPLSPTVRHRLRSALPHIVIIDAVGSSESGTQLSAVLSEADQPATATFSAHSDTGVLAADFSRILTKHDNDDGWLARRDLIPLGYLRDEAKTARTFPVVDGIRWSVPGDRARLLADGRIELLGRDAVTINTGGEKVFAEEVERAVAAHPDIYDVVVVGRPSPRWGHEVVAIVQLAERCSPTDGELAEHCRRHLAGYKVPKAFIQADEIQRSPAGKADYRWAKAIANADEREHSARRAHQSTVGRRKAL
jgi:acyl-CoA synthetase (AMP-forming)/AMP-acid ligase II